MIHDKRLKDLKRRDGGEMQQPSNKLVCCNKNSQTVLQICPVKQGVNYLENKELKIRKKCF